MGNMNGKIPAGEKIPRDEFQGSISFDIQVSHKTFGNLHLRGEFPRLKPALVRNELSAAENKAMRSILLEWAPKYFDISKRPTYFSDIIECVILFQVYGDPWAPLYSPQMELGMKMILWDWVCDEFVEEAPNSGIPHHIIRSSLGDLLKQMDFKDELSLAHIHPYFLPLFISLESLRKPFLDLHPNYEKDWPFQRRIRKKYFEGSQYRLAHPPISSDMYNHWRRITAYCEGSLLRCAMIHGIMPAEHVLDSAEMSRLFDIVNTFGGLVNDVLGIRKDIENEEDNFILFNLRKGISPEIAVLGVCKKVRQGMREYFHLQKVLLETYPDEKHLEKFFHLMDGYSDSLNRIYGKGRYNKEGEIQLMYRKI